MEEGTPHFVLFSFSLSFSLQIKKMASQMNFGPEWYAL